MPQSYRFTQPNNSFYEEPLTPSTQLLVDEAISQGYEVNIPVDARLIVLSKNGRSAMVQAQTTEATSYIGYYATEDKGVGRALLQAAGLQIPRGFVVRAGQSKTVWLDAFQTLTKPIVVKPTHGTQGQKVFMNIVSEVEFTEAVATCFDQAVGEGPGVVIEEQFAGQEYRVIATKSEALAVMYRMPANVVGDGVHTIQELIDIKNSDPRRSDHETGVLVKIKINEVVLSYLNGQQLSLTSIIEKDRRVFLRSNSNISTGGDSIDMTDEAHSSVKELAVRAINAIPGLAYAGVDFMSTDITSEQNQQTYRIIELNKSPGFSIHEQPYQGKPRHISKALLHLLFP
ncbi:ATP-grasp domain-containing protein [Candidatus Woesebacteria bacterium]|nr:ATP-grasp domain-containing protein [Candidatus Woesebacteria bacterium]